MRIRIFLKDLKSDSVSFTFKKGSKDFLYLSSVLRVSIGDNIFLFNENCESLFLVDFIEKNSILLKLSPESNSVKFSDEKLKNISLFVPLIKPDKLNLIAKQAVEIGIKFLCLVKMDRSSVGSFNQERITANMNEALEQSGGYKMTEVLYFKDLSSAIFNFKDWDIFYGKYHATNLENKLMIKTKKICVVVGPEGGFSQEESVFLSKYRYISIGSRILRTETAAMSMMTFADFVTD